MNQITKRQHYVQKAYLKSWVSNKKIWAIRKESKKIYPSDLMGVAQERYFYKLEDLTEAEITFLENFISQKVPSVLQGLNRDFLYYFNAHLSMKNSLSRSNIADEKKEYIKKEIQDMIKMNMELAHGKIENLGSTLLKGIENNSFSFLNETEIFFETMMYISFQYFRTKKMKNIMMDAIDSERKIISSKIWPQMSYILSTILAKNLSLDKDICITILNSPEDMAFLTGDQPIINLLGEELDSDGYVKDLVLYYPLSPTKSMLIEFEKGENEKIKYKNLSKDEIVFYNSKIVELADDYIYANKEIFLKEISKHF